MIIYADITFLNNFLMTLAIIWAVANIMEIEYKWWRLIVTALIGTTYFFIVIIIQLQYFPFIIKIIVHIVLNIITALIMVKTAYSNLSKSNFIKAIGYLYLVTFLTMGTTLSIFYITGGSPFKPGIQRLLTGVLVLLILGNYGWCLFQKYSSPREFHLPVRVFFKDNIISITGLIDTGNSLSDPLTKAPVIVVNRDDILPLFPDQIQKELSIKDDPFEIVNIFNNNDLGQRTRILPFSDLGQENGILTGFRPDLIEVEYQGQVLKIKKCILALSQRRLDDEDEYQALIHPGIIKINV